jgi:hypothetical protein
MMIESKKALARESTPQFNYTIFPSCTSLISNVLSRDKSDVTCCQLCVTGLIRHSASRIVCTNESRSTTR